MPFLAGGGVIGHGGLPSWVSAAPEVVHLPGGAEAIPAPTTVHVRNPGPSTGGNTLVDVVESTLMLDGRPAAKAVQRASTRAQSLP